MVFKQGLLKKIIIACGGLLFLALLAGCGYMDFPAGEAYFSPKLDHHKHIHHHHTVETHDR